MSDETNVDLTAVLDRIRSGDPKASDELFRMVKRELESLASRFLKNERVGHTLQTTALVNEAAIRLLGGLENLTDRSHFFRAAAMAMRFVLVDHARMRMAEKRGSKRGPTALTDDSGIFGVDLDPTFLVTLHDALEKLAEISEPQAEAFQLWYFAGLTAEEISALIDRSPRTVQGDLKAARAWLYGQFRE